MHLTPTLLKTTSRHIKKLGDAGVQTVEDFLALYPRDYKDKTNVVEHFFAINLKEANTMRVMIETLTEERTRTGKLLQKAVIRDADGIYAEAVWFGQRGMTRKFQPGSMVVLHGKARYQYSKLSFVSPDISHIDHSSGLEGIYSDVNTVPGYWIAEKMPLVRSHISGLSDILSEYIRRKHDFPTKAEAVETIHFPASREDADRARGMLAYEELYTVQSEHAKKRELHTDVTRGRTVSIPLSAERMKAILGHFSYTFTTTQKKVCYQILQDMAGDRAMYRLLQGDVGTGKTAVAFATGLHAILESGGQVAVMAPTEILARQHFEGFEALGFPLGVRSDLLVGWMTAREKQDAKMRLSNHETDIIFGTHALIQEDVRFHRLVYAIIDEQHRFGVDQRKRLEDSFADESLSDSHVYPHVLSMTATPIPRTLTITLYGDQDLSILDEYPAGRKLIHTAVIPASERERAHRWIDREIESGRQVYWISPLVEDSEKLEVASATQTFERLSEIFSNRRIGLLHGRLSSQEKRDIIDAFNRGDIDILSSTSVVEVGVDNPNATVMCIEGAERFGLSQLHQFRGRVGRGSHQSYCYLFSTTEQKNERLAAIESTQDGFELAETDLALRGPGEVYGVRQSGLPELRVADFRDLELVETVREDIRESEKNSLTYDK